MIARIAVAGLTLLPTVVSAADLRVAKVRYDGGAGQYLVADNQYVVCDKCPPVRRLVDMPAAPPAPADNTPEVLGVIGRIPIPASSLKVPPSDPETADSEMSAKKSHPLATVYFNLNDARLRPGEKRRIRTAVAGGIENGVAVRVEGYACRIGKAAYNRKLSARRAKAVSRYLQALGVPVSGVIGLGNAHPLGGPLSKDRRAEIVIKETQP